jgi:hypothetical protein
MDNSRKRRASNSRLSNSHATKRLKCDNDTYDAFTEEQHSIIENTAAFFQIHPSDLSAAISSLRNTSRTASIPSNKAAFDSNAPQPQTDYSRPNYLEETDFLGLQAIAMNDEWEPSGGASQSSMTNKIFGINIEPAAWSTCFANFIQPENVSMVTHYDDTQVEHTNGHNDASYSEKSSALPFNSSHSNQNSEHLSTNRNQEVTVCSYSPAI